MTDHFSITTNRLSIQPLTINDGEFIFELLNTEGWLRYIGNRNITSLEEANAYIQNIVSNNNIRYWVVKLKEDKTKTGIITFIKRDHLEHPDLGFAFLPNYGKQGYAYEAANAVVQKLMQKQMASRILAITLPHNTRSVHLLEKLGFMFEKGLEVEGETLCVYGLAVDGLA